MEVSVNMLIAMMKEQNSMTLGDLCHLCEYHLDYIPEVAELQ
jgi:hypothetical protein